MVNDIPWIQIQKFKMLYINISQSQVILLLLFILPFHPLKFIITIIIIKEMHR